MYLASNGIHCVDWHTVLASDDDLRAAVCIIAGELNGGKFNWERMAWDEVKA